MIPDQQLRDQGWRVGLILILAMSSTLPASPWSRSQESPNHDWVGKRVVQRFNNFPVRVDGEAVLRSGTDIYIYRVQAPTGKNSGSRQRTTDRRDLPRLTSLCWLTKLLPCSRNAFGPTRTISFLISKSGTPQRP